MNISLLFLLLAGEPVRLESVKPEVIQERLEAVQRDNHARRKTIEALFTNAGCDSLTVQPVSRSKEPNVVCTLGGGESTIVVGAHFDAGHAGMGAVDDWSGAALLPSLYQSLARHPRRHRFVFVAFAAEEEGLIGSRGYVKKLDKKGRAAIDAMVNLECLGVAAPSIWASRADKRLASAYIDVAKYLGQEPAGSNVEAVGDDDSHPFLEAKIPVITFHSLTNQTWKILHSPRDTLQAIDPKQYYDAYRLVSLYLAYIDQK
jgi:Iap family predicted aminopeptidase